MEHNNRLSYAMSGDLGDIIYSMRVCHQLNDSKSIYYIVDRPFTKPWNESRLNALIPLMSSQSYLGKVVYIEPEEKLTHDFIDFRRGGLPFGKSLSEIHADWVGVKLNPYEPWLKVNPSKESAGRIIVHKSPRYANNNFPWRALAEKYGKRMLAVGLPDEYEIIKNALGINVEFKNTKSYYELAQLIAGAELFIGNQSSPCAIALGLGVPVVQETSTRAPDCIIKGANAYYGWSSDVVIDGIRYGKKSQIYIDEKVVPPGGWIIHRENKTRIHSTSIGSIANELIREKGISREKAVELILEENTARVRRDYPTFQPSKETEVLRIIKEKGCHQNVKTNLNSNLR